MKPDLKLALARLTRAFLVPGTPRAAWVGLRYRYGK